MASTPQQNQSQIANALSTQTGVLNQMLGALNKINNITVNTSGFVSQQDLQTSFSDALKETNSILRESKDLLQGIKDCCEKGSPGGSSNSNNAPGNSRSTQTSLQSGMMAGIKSFAGKVGNVFGRALSGTGSIIKGVGSGFAGAAKSLFSFVKGLGPLSIAVNVFKLSWSVFEKTITYTSRLIQKLIMTSINLGEVATKAGNQFRNVMADINNEIEGVKETFDLDSTIGSGFRKINDSANELILTSADVSNELTKLFGTGLGAITKYIDALKTAFSDMGQFADIIAGSISKSTENALLFIKTTKALGLAGDDIKYFAMQSSKNLVPIYETLDNVLMNISETSSQFGVDRKLLSKNFMTLRKDIMNFGHMSNQELTRTAARLTQLGITGDAAIKVFNKMDTFESAAQSAAMLSQVFGMNVDALRLIRAENPLEIIEMFRESMYMTGRSFDDLNRHEKALMAQHTGLNEEQLNMIMNYRSMGMAFDEIQTKLKESDPTEQQRKNIQNMEGSLRQIRNVLQGKNVFTDFVEGAKMSIIYGTDLGQRLSYASKEIENFRMAGLKLSDSSKKSINNLLKPFTDVVEELFGNKGKSGIFNAKNFNSMLESFTKDFGGLFAQVFDKNADIKAVQASFTKKLSEIFNPDTLLKSNNIGIQLLKTGGKFVGQLLRGFAAIGPGILDIIDGAVKGTVNFFDQENSTFRDMFKLLFSLEDGDIAAIYSTFVKLGETIQGLIVPIAKFFGNILYMLVADVAPKIATAVWDAIFPQWLRTTLKVAGVAGVGALAVATGGASLIPSIGYALGAGGLTAGGISTGALVAGSTIAGGAIGYGMSNTPSKDENPPKQTSAKDWLSDALVGGKAVIQKNLSGLSVTRLDPNDQILAGMNGGPIVDAIRYSGNVAAGLADLITTNMERARETKPLEVENQRPIEVTLTLDSEVVTKVLLNNDLIGKAGRLEYTRGATRLQNTAQVNPAGGSTEASAY